MHDNFEISLFMKCHANFKLRHRSFTLTALGPRTAFYPALWAGLFAPLVALSQDTGVGGQTEPASGSQASVIQRVEIVARQGSTELRRAASVAKQIYGREELDRYGDTNTMDVLRRLPGVNVD